MNITHAEHEEVNGDKLVAIFNRQKELMNKYHDIEKRSGLLQTEDCPVNLNDKRGQARIKDFSWRIIEEVGEALDALNVHCDEEHFKEELIDGLHFLVELSILAGIEPKDVLPVEMVVEDYLNDMLEKLWEEHYVLLFQDDNEDEVISQIISDLVMYLGMMCNCLKNKPWKQTNMITDVEQFKSYLRKVWGVYIALLSTRMDADEITDVYLKKSQVNKFRQRSNY